MIKEIVNSVNAPQPIGPYSQGVKAGGFLFISGQIPINYKNNKIETDDVKEQTMTVLENLGSILNEAGLDFSNIVKTTLYIKDMNDFPIINDVYKKYFSENPPARSTVEVSRLPRDVKIEDEAIAHL